MKELSRRDFLRIAGLTAAGAALGLRVDDDPVFKVGLDIDSKLSIREAVSLAIRFDRLYDALPPQEFPVTVESLNNWIREIVPMFEYNGIVAHSVFPRESLFFNFLEGRMHNHVLGQSDCKNWIRINGRTNNPNSSWFDSEDFAFTVAHELAHVQQTQELCIANTSQQIETSAQIAALEVMCSLANGGNEKAVYAVVNELRGMAMTSAYGLLLKAGKESDYSKLRGRLSPGALSRGSFERSRRYWMDKRQELESLIEKYYTYPLELLIEASRAGGEVSLAFPPIYFRPYGAALVFTSEPETIKLDDTLYFLENAEEMVFDLLTRG